MRLVLSRKVGQSIIINGNTKVTVVAINGNQITLATEAPKDVTVDREEIHLSKLNNPR